MGHIFAKPRDPITEEHRTDAIYSIACNECEYKYIKQTKRQVGTCFKEHQRAFFLLAFSFTGTHLLNPTIQLGGIRLKLLPIIDVYHQRFCFEAQYINSANTPYNRDDSSFLPDAQLQVKGQLISKIIKGALVAAIRSALVKALDRSVETLGL